MEYEIFGGSLPAVRIALQPGESVVTQSAGMCWMSDGISIDTNFRGGLLKGISRVFRGDTLFLAIYSAEKEGQSLICAAKFPGSILSLALEETGELIIQKEAFLLAQPEVTIAPERVGGTGKGLLSGQGLELRRLSGRGRVFLELDGSTEVRELTAGESLLATIGSVAAYSSDVQYTVQTVRGFRDALFGGDSLQLARLEGPGRVWLQTMTMHDLTGRLVSFMPRGEDTENR